MPIALLRSIDMGSPAGMSKHGNTTYRPSPVTDGRPSVSRFHAYQPSPVPSVHAGAAPSADGVLGTATVCTACASDRETVSTYTGCATAASPALTRITINVCPSGAAVAVAVALTDADADDDGETLPEADSDGESLPLCVDVSDGVIELVSV